MVTLWSVPLRRCGERLYSIFWQCCEISGQICSNNKWKKATVILLYFSDTSPAIIIQPEQSQRMHAFSLFQSQMKCHSQEFQMLEISSFVFIPYLHKSQNRIPLKGISPTVCFKCKTNKFPTQVLRFRFQWKCRVNQMWKYHRAMNISL